MDLDHEILKDHLGITKVGDRIKILKLKSRTPPTPLASSASSPEIVDSKLQLNNIVILEPISKGHFGQGTFP